MPTASGHTSAITARKVIDSNVYDSAGQQIGEIKDIVLDKTSNNIMFAVVGFGGFLGLGEKYHPIPWSELNYSEEHKGYVVNLTVDQLSSAPTASIEDLTKYDGRPFRDQAFAHYRSPPYWH
jgi:sporulation protein YlmC with PRC-barrel domain